MKLLQDLAFGAGGSGVGCLGRGWSDPEPRHTWAVDTVSTVSFTMAEGHPAYYVLMRVAPVFGWLPLTIWCDGHFLGRHLVYEECEIGVAVPASLLDGGVLRLNIYHFLRHRVSDLRPGSDDARLLSVSLSGARVWGSGLMPALAASQPRCALSNAELMGRFQSLGDNCEFGLTQRAAGAEPLGLLRFAGIRSAMVIQGLVTGFETLTDPDRLSIYRDPGAPWGAELIIRHDVYVLQQHTFKYEGQDDPAAVLNAAAIKLDYERRSLFEDLEDADKVFVVKRNEGMGLPDVLPLWSVLRAHGPNTLLWVTQAGPERLPGSVEWRGPGLLCGYIDRLAPYDDAFNISDDCWLAICRNAYALAHENPSRQPSSFA
jgi:hypothetical protein